MTQAENTLTFVNWVMLRQENRKPADRTGPALNLSCAMCSQTYSNTVRNHTAVFRLSIEEKNKSNACSKAPSLCVNLFHCAASFRQTSGIWYIFKREIVKKNVSFSHSPFFLKMWRWNEIGWKREKEVISYNMAFTSPLQEATVDFCWAGLFIHSSRRKRLLNRIGCRRHIGTLLLVKMRLWRARSCSGNDVVLPLPT